jgi:putative PIN family toxin of toxin-antitoxin system
LLVTSPALLDELDEKLRLKFKVSAEDADVIRARIQINALVVEPGIVLNIVSDDPDDNRVLEAAVAGKADYVVSGDRHLLKVGSVEGIPILTTRQFMDIVEAVL